MRPERDNIAAPDLPEGIEWVGEAPGSMPALTAAGPALVHFLDFAQLNSVRTLPYLVEWDRRYRDARPEHDRRPGAALPVRRRPRGGRGRPGAARGRRSRSRSTPSRELWHAYGCEGWPSLFLWKQGGALAWFHFGEGEYRATEEAIQAELRELDALRELPGADGAAAPHRRPRRPVIAPTPELFPGGSWERPWTPGEDGERARGPLRGRRRLRHRRGRAARSRSSSTAVGPADRAPTIDGPALYPLAEQHPLHTTPRPRPRSGRQLRRRVP